LQKLYVKGGNAMQDRTTALKILGLSEDAQRQEIESRYFHLVKKYKHLAQDERPSFGEPIFAIINEAYRFLIGYAPLQKIQFRKLGWKEKLQHIREYYLVEIVVCIGMAFAIFAAGVGIHEMSKSYQTKATNTNMTSTAVNPFPMSECNGTNKVKP
jgi:hypothetical protein